MSFKEFLLARVDILFSGVKPLVHFGEGYYGEQMCEIIFKFGITVLGNISLSVLLLL